jgi:hypothetical protein
MKIEIKRAIGFVVGAGVVTFIAWMSGYDFARGETGFMYSVFTIAGGFLGSCFPFKEWE